MHLKYFGIIIILQSYKNIKQKKPHSAHIHLRQNCRNKRNHLKGPINFILSNKKQCFVKIYYIKIEIALNQKIYIIS